jgi:oligopeptidase B
MIQPPRAKKRKKELTIHGHTRRDDYYWLKERDNPEVRAYLQAENDYTKAVIRHTEPFQEKLFAEIVGRIKQTDMSVPFEKNGYYYYTRFEEGREYPVFCRKKSGPRAGEEILLDVNQLAEGHEYFQVAGLQVSIDNRMLAFGVDTWGSRKYMLRFKNLYSGEMLKDEIPGTTGTAAWANDNKTIFYTLKDQAFRPYKIYKHIIGEDISRDEEVYHEADETFRTYVRKSKSDRYILIGSYSTLSSEYRYLEAHRPAGEFKMILPRQKDMEYHVAHFEDHFYIRTNFLARNFRLVKTPLTQTGLEHWQEVIPHREDVLLEEFEIFKEFLVAEERKNGLTALRVIRWADMSVHAIDFGEETYTAYISVNPEFDTPWLRFGYSSLTTPDSVFDYHMKSRRRKLLKRQEVLGDFDSKNYKAQRLYAAAPDGSRIPVSLVYRKGVKRNGGNPLLLYGYGSYGHSLEPSFNSIHLSLLDRGFVYAIAHVRGGQEMGRRWYEEGKLLKKKNTFGDFIACAQHLVAEKWTNRGKLFAMGGSAGGLLLGAVINMRPDLFKGVVAVVPFVDVVTTMLDDSIPLTTGEYDEWGNPHEKAYYEYMLAYSPYDNVAARDYPAMLVTAGLHDSQVQYWEPAKWVARLREKKTDQNPLLLYTNMEAGHSGVSGRFRKLREIALHYAFILNLLDKNE